jgi:hypothetical protein
VLLVNEGSIASLLCRLYDLCVSRIDDKGGNRIAKGHKFEDDTSEQIYHFARDEGFDPNPPRTMLNLQTLSGNVHQFDASFRNGGEIFVIECKNTREAAKEYLYVFNAKILDYVHALEPEQGLSIRGIFLSTVPVAQSAWRYGLAYGVRIVDPESPPPEYVMRNSADQSLVSGFERIIDKMADLAERHARLHKPTIILEEYRFLCRRWKDGLEQPC